MNYQKCFGASIRTTSQKCAAPRIDGEGFSRSFLRQEVVSLHFLARENQMDCPPRGGLSRLHQHVHSRDVPVLHPKRPNGSRDPVEIFALHRDIDISSEAPGVGLRLFHVEINCQTANHAVFEPGGRERRFHPSCQVKELFHAFLKERIDVKRHGVPFRIIASAAAAKPATQAAPFSARSTVSGNRSITVRQARIALGGSVLPSSHSCKVRTLKPYRPANSDCDNPDFARIALTSTGPGTS